MIINGKVLFDAAPIKDMYSEKKRENGVSYGLAEAGYDIRVKQEIYFTGHQEWSTNGEYLYVPHGTLDGQTFDGCFTIASAIEEFQMPNDLVGVVHDKSTWARKGLSVFNTVIEPGWNGFLTLELVYHGQEPLHIPAGSGIAQILFSQTVADGIYDGKYQGQEDRPVEAKFE